MCVCVFTHVGMCRSEDNLQELILSFNHVYSGNPSQVIRLSGKRVYQLNLLACPLNNYFDA